MPGECGRPVVTPGPKNAHWQGRGTGAANSRRVGGSTVADQLAIDDGPDEAMGDLDMSDLAEESASPSFF